MAAYSGQVVFDGGDCGRGCSYSNRKILLASPWCCRVRLKVRYLERCGLEKELWRGDSDLADVVKLALEARALKSSLIRRRWVNLSKLSSTRRRARRT